MKKPTPILSKILSLSLALCSLACSSTFSLGNSSNVGANQSQAVTVTWATLDLSGKISGGRFASFAAVTLDKNAKTVTLTLPVPATPYLLNSADFAVPKVPGASYSLAMLADGAASFSLTLPLAALVNGAPLGAAASLPTGAPLPGVSGGKMPATSVALNGISKVTSTLFSAPGQVGLYVSTAFDPMVNLTYPIKSSDGAHTWGSWTTVPAKGTINGGYYLSLDLPTDVVSALASAL